ncbi:ABC transporter substrate-binding protein [Aestuariivirga sp.]|uniref:ABC transporter substrate-binding protein n=1 Tax=Aestuariivirga sp. TaxID=2650926 RepID=UPI0039E5CAE5
MKRSNGLSRRGMLQASIGAALMAVGSKPGRAATPKRGGTLRAGLSHGSTTDVTDPAKCSNGFTQTLGYALFNGLTEAGPDGNLVPALAETWEARPGADTWHFALRKDVTFHNGKTLTSEDVIASMNRHRGDGSSSGAKGILSNIKDIQADGEHNVVFALNSPSADFPFILSDFHLGILPAKDGAVDPASTVGTGSYELAEFNPGVKAVLRRSGSHWRSDRGFFSDVELLTIADSTARTNALLAGEIDVMNSCDLKTIDYLKANAAIAVEETQGTQHYCFAMQTDQAPFKDNNVRLALKYAIDRQELVQKILGGFGYEGNDHPIGRSNRYFAKSLEQRTYDPDRARHYLKQAGLENLRVSLSVANAAFEGAIDSGLLYSASAKKAGIDLNVVREPDDGYWSNVWLKKPWAASYWGGRPTEDWMFSTAYAAGVPWNETHWDNAAFNRLLLAARGELDDAKRRDMYVEMQRLVSDDGGALIPMFASYVFARNNQVERPEVIAADWELDGLRFFERWWFA